MINNPLISVIIPVYNTNLFFLKKCFESINEQTFKNLEIIIVDSSDDALVSDFVADFSFRSKQVKKITSKKGVSLQRNLGIENSSGDYISFIDSDDYINKDYFSELLYSVVHHKADISFPLISKKIYKDEVVVSSWDFNHKDREIELSEENYFLFSHNNAFVHPVKLYKRDIIGDTRFDIYLKFGEDLIFNYEISKKQPKAVFTDKSIYSYCSEDKTNLVKRHLDLSLFEFLNRIIAIYRERKKNKKEHLSVLPFFNNPFLNFYYNACKSISIKWLFLSLKYRFFYFFHNATFKNFFYMFFPILFSLIKKMFGRYN